MCNEAGKMQDSPNQPGLTDHIRISYNFEFWVRRGSGLKCWKILYMNSFEIQCIMFLIISFFWMIPHEVPWNWMLNEDKNYFSGRRWLCRIHYHTWPSRELDLCWPPSHGKTLQATSAPMARSSHPTTAPPSWCLQITSLHETLLLR